ncbi:amidohydrolase family protein [Herbiconiux sp. 11R-BC]|uniref:amidohydrolase family protein n=1 Tax=Herbiconiux sp. 11R-BC TaxID=3111637 RepID=UPI003C055F6D
MAELEIIDAHHHLADLSRSYPWLEGPAEPFRYHGDDRPLRRSYFLDDYLADTRGYALIGSVHIENGAADPLAETRWIDEVARAHALPSAHVAKVSLLHPDAPARLREQAGFGLVRGIRDILNWHPDPVLTHRDRGDIMADPVWRANFALLEELGLSFDLQVFPSQLEEAARLAGEHPGVRIILDHAGMPIGRDAGSRAEWARGMRALAGHPNVVTKVSALGTNDHHWTRESIAPFVLETIDIFTPQRTMFGSNFPVDSLYSSFGELFAAFDALTADLDQADRRALFVGTAARAYRL